MKKVLAILALAMFIGGITVPAVAAINSDLTVITLTEDDPAQKETTTEKTTEKTAETKTKSGDCGHEKAEAPKTAEKKSSGCDAPEEKSQTAKK